MEEIKEAKEEKLVEPKVEAPKVDPYIVYGEGFSITQSEYIEFYKNRFKFLAYKNNLVGRFNDRGRYVIASEIKADLVRMPKQIENMGGDFYKASNVYMKKFFYFDVKITMGEHGKAVASLYLTENVGVYMENPHIISHIADFEDDFNDEFRVKVRKAFNLVDIVVPVSDLMVPELAVIMQNNFDFVLINESLFDIISQIYILRMLEILEKSGPEGQKVVERYKQLVTENEAGLNIKNKNNALKALLDRAIDEHGGLENLNINKEAKTKVIKEVNTSVGKVEQVQKASGVEAINTHSKESHKTEKGDSPKKSTSKKPDVKKAAKKPEKGGKPTKGKESAPYDFIGEIAAAAWLDDRESHGRGEDNSSTNGAGLNNGDRQSGGQEQEILNPVNIDDYDNDDMTPTDVVPAKININTNIQDVSDGIELEDEEEIQDGEVNFKGALNRETSQREEENS